MTSPPRFSDITDQFYSGVFRPAFRQANKFCRSAAGGAHCGNCGRAKPPVTRKPAELQGAALADVLNRARAHAASTGHVG